MLRPTFGSLPDPPLAIENKIEHESDFNVYPNPTTGVINFNIENNSNNTYTIQLIDIYGKTIIATQSSISNSIDASNLSNGLYIIRFTNNVSNKSILKKVIISK